MFAAHPQEVPPVPPAPTVIGNAVAETVNPVGFDKGLAV
jgi:hypothetical protein